METLLKRNVKMNEQEHDNHILTLFANSTNGAVTKDRETENIALTIRGIAKKKTIKNCEKTGRDFYYVDTGYFGNFPSLGNPTGKKIYHRIVKNDLQHSTIKPRPSDRWMKLVGQDPRLEWKGWKRNGKKILLVLPNPKACNYYNFDTQTWVEETTKEIKKHTDMPIEIRVKGSRSYRNHEYSIYDAFNSGVHATVCFNSIAALESVLYGIPAFVSVPCAASPISNTDLSQLMNPWLPQRELIIAQCQNLAYGQFTVEEITNGTAWKILNEFAD
jgi:hypothetical protein